MSNQGGQQCQASKHTDSTPGNDVQFLQADEYQD